MKKVVTSLNAPKPVGPYSQAIQANGLLFVSGQIPLDPQSGKIVTGAIQDQARRVLENLKAILETAGTSLEDVVKTTIFLKDIKFFDEVNQLYEEYFGVSRPARTTVEVSQLPKGVGIEIDAIAVIPHDSKLRTPNSKLQT